MNRRELLKMISAATGTAMIGGGALLSGCSREPSDSDISTAQLVFSVNDVQLLDEIAETILPRTDTPGAKDAQVGQFMTVYVRDCYTEKEQNLFHSGLVQLQETSLATYGQEFIDLVAEQRLELVQELDTQAKTQLAESDQPHYFTMFKQLTLFGFFTSEPGATQALQYVAVPGRYDGCIDYEEGDRGWAT